MKKICICFLILTVPIELAAKNYQDCVRMVNNPPKNGDGIASVRHFKKVWKDCQRTFNDDVDAIVLLNLGRNQLVAGMAEGGETYYLHDSLATLNKAIKKAPHDARLYGFKAVALQELQKYNDALEAHDKSLELNPNNSDYYYNRGYLYLEKLGNPRSAYENFVQALKLNPDNAKARRDRAKVLNSLSRYDEALTDIAMLVSRFPRDRDMYTIRATSYVGLGDTEQAINELQKSLEIQYDQEIKSRLEFLQSNQAASNKKEEPFNVGVSKGITISDIEGKNIGSFENSYALLIGVSEYHSSGWPNLPNIPSELEKVEDSLVSRGFNVTSVMNPSSYELKEQLDSFVSEHGWDRNNRLLFLFSGHGYTRNQGNKGYIVPSDAPSPLKDEKGFLSKALSMTRILSLAREIESRHALFLFDSCFSGTIFKTRALPDEPPLITRLSTMPTRQFITAGDAGETVPAKSVFIPAFLDAIDHGLGDLNSDGYVTGTELGLFLQSNLGNLGIQTPQFGKINDYELSRGDFVFRAKF